MPIEIDKQVQQVSREEYHEIDHGVTGLAFQIQNDFGRLLDEPLYQNELAIRCRRAGLSVDREVGIRVVHGSFVKKYYLDLLVDNSVIIEAKCVESLLPIHHAQLLNYLFLCDMRHGTLLNFRSPKVERRFVTAALSAKERRKFTIYDSAWNPTCPLLAGLKSRMCALLQDWGVCLTTELYSEALLHLCSGGSPKPGLIDVFSGNAVIGTQSVPLLGDDTAFHVSGLEKTAPLQSNLQRFLDHTRLKSIGWINLHQTDVVFKTLTHSSIS